ncbi:protein of unknown function [Rhodovastum atsumiense]|nr:protein of unknown function [Rhodovastum atsumiense]
MPECLVRKQEMHAPVHGRDRCAVSRDEAGIPDRAIQMSRLRNQPRGDIYPDHLIEPPGQGTREAAMSAAMIEGKALPRRNVIGLEHGIDHHPGALLALREKPCLFAIPVAGISVDERRLPGAFIPCQFHISGR